MKLYDSIGPNPHVVRMVLAEKGLAVERQRLDLPGGENRRPPFTTLNPLGTLPALQLDDGTVLTEITAIAEYLEELQPDPPLIGRTMPERAGTRMWVRRLDLMILESMVQGYQYGEGLPMFRDRLFCIPEAADGLKAKARHGLAWLDGTMAGRGFVAGDRFTLADITLFCFLRFAGKVGQPMDPAWTNLAAWFDRVAGRPTARS